MFLSQTRLEELDPVRLLQVESPGVGPGEYLTGERSAPGLPEGLVDFIAYLVAAPADGGAETRGDLPEALPSLDRQPLQRPGGHSEEGSPPPGMSDGNCPPLRSGEDYREAVGREHPEGYSGYPCDHSVRLGAVSAVVAGSPPLSGGNDFGTMNLTDESPAVPWETGRLFEPPPVLPDPLRPVSLPGREIQACEPSAAHTTVPESKSVGHPPVLEKIDGEPGHPSPAMLPERGSQASLPSRGERARRYSLQRRSLFSPVSMKSQGKISSRPRGR